MAWLTSGRSRAALVPDRHAVYRTDTASICPGFRQPQAAAFHPRRGSNANNPAKPPLHHPYASTTRSIGLRRPFSGTISDHVLCRLQRSQRLLRDSGRPQSSNYGAKPACRRKTSRRASTDESTRSSPSSRGPTRSSPSSTGLRLPQRRDAAPPYRFARQRADRRFRADGSVSCESLSLRRSHRAHRRNDRAARRMPQTADWSNAWGSTCSAHRSRRDEPTSLARFMSYLRGAIAELRKHRGGLLSPAHRDLSTARNSRGRGDLTSILLPRRP